MNENGDKKDRILLLLKNCLVFLVQNQSKNEYDFEFRIPLNNYNQSSIVQLKKVSNIDNLNAYGDLSSIVNRSCFELLNINLYPTFKNSNSHSISCNRLLVSCKTHYDLKLWLDLLTNILQKFKKETPTNTLQTSKSNSNNTMNKQDSNLSLNNNNQKKIKSSSSSKLNHSLSSGNNVTFANNNTSTLNNTGLIYQRKTYAFRPHPPLIPHFQLPNDQSTNNYEGTATLKRFMYKKPKLTEPFGKCTYRKITIL